MRSKHQVAALLFSAVALALVAAGSGLAGGSHSKASTASGPSGWVAKSSSRPVRQSRWPTAGSGSARTAAYSAAMRARQSASWSEVWAVVMGPRSH